MAIEAWERLSPAHKQTAMVAMVVCCGLAVLVFFLAGGPSPPGRSDGKGARVQTDQMLVSSQAKELGIEGVAQEVGSLERELQTMKQQIEQRYAKDLKDRETQNDLLRAEIASLRANLQRSESSRRPARPQGPELPGPGHVPATSVDGIAPAPSPQPIQIRTFGQVAATTADLVVEPAQQPATGTAASARHHVDDFLPAGSLLSGILITGLDAPTGQGAKGEPIPILVRITDEAILPSLLTADVRECFVVGSGYGSLSSERAYLRAEAFSCVRADGTVIEQDIEMVAIGEDGKAGLRGNVVSKQGAVLAKAALAGVADGFARASQPSFGVASGGFAVGRSLESGALGGASSALDRVATYFLEQADAIFPVIEIHAMREVSFLVVRGTELRLNGDPS